MVSQMLFFSDDGFGKFVVNKMNTNDEDVVVSLLLLEYYLNFL